MRGNHKNSEFNKLRDDLFCNYCGKQCKSLNALKQHEARCKLNPEAIPCTIPKDKCGWSKGLTKNDCESLKLHSQYMSQYWSEHDNPFKGKHHTDEFKNKLSEQARDSNYQSHWGTRKSYKYKGKKFISSYEVRIAMSLDENNIRWEKPDYGIFTYIDLNGKKHTYTPDLYLPDYNVYLDPKNDFLIENINPTLGYSDKDKINWVMEQNGVRVIILNKNQLDWYVIKTLI